MDCSIAILSALFALYVLFAPYRFSGRIEERVFRVCTWSLETYLMPIL